MDFLLLGPIRVRVGERELALAGLRQQTLLALLVLRAGRSVGLAELVDAIWGDDPPETARSQVHNAVWHVRKTLQRHGADALIQNEPNGYRLSLPPESVDVHRFEAGVAEGRRLRQAGDVAGSARVLRAALGLWRGPALDGVDGARLRREAVRLDEQRVSVWEDCVESELDGGVAGPELAAELATLVEEYPLRERLVAALMLAWYRAGRQAEALALYRRTAATLRDELGVDPGPELTGRFAAILRRDPDLIAGRPARAAATEVVAGVELTRPAQLPATSAFFVGRAAELAQLDEWLAAAEQPGAAGLVATIQGPGGVGKTTLALHWAHRVAPRFVDGQLYVNLQGFATTDSAVAPAEALRAMLEALRVPTSRMPSDVDGRAGLLRTLLTGRRVLIVLDNARHAEQVQPLLPGSNGCVVIVTSRNQLSSLAAVADARPLTLTVLSTVEARELLARRLGADRVGSQAAASEDIVALCAGLPLALAVVAARAATNPHFELDSLAGELRDAHRRLDALDSGDAVADVRAVLAASYRTLSEPAARLFRLLGVHPGPDVSAPAAASLAGLPAAQVRSLLVELVRAHMLIESQPGRYSFHDLLRAYAAELVDLPTQDPDRAASVIRMIDHYLHTAHAADRLINPHREPIAIGECVDGVAPELFAEPDPAASWLLTELPVLQSVVALAERIGQHARAWQLAWSLSTTFARHSYFDSWVATGEIGVRAAQRSGDLVAQAHAHRGQGSVYNALGRREDARAQLLLAIDRYRELGNLSGQAQTHLNLAVTEEGLGQLGAAASLAELARSLFEQVGNRPGVARALNQAGWYRTLNGEHLGAIALCEEALVLHEEFDDLEGQADALDSIGRAYLYLGETDRALLFVRRAVDCYRSIGDHFNAAAALVRLGDNCQATGHLDQARTAWQEALAIREQLGSSDVDELRAKLEQIPTTT